MCYAWFLSGYNYFNVVIDEKSAFNNARDCFQLFFQRSVNSSLHSSEVHRFQLREGYFLLSASG